jgi:Lipocalin-like domain
MKKQFLILFAVLGLGLASCSKGDDVTPSTLEGTYNLETISLKSKVVDQVAENENVSAQKMYYTFSADGTYKTNATWTIGEINSSGVVSTGKYTINGDKLNITYKDNDLGKELTQTMQIKTNSDSQLVLFIGLDELKASLKAAAGGLDAFTAAFLEIFLSQMVQFEYTLTFKKA